MAAAERAVPAVGRALRAEQWLIGAPARQAGATIAIPFYSRENGNL